MNKVFLFLCFSGVMLAPGIKSIKLKNQPGKDYPGNGVQTLVDGKMGSADIRDKTWMGFEGNDFEAIVKFSSSRKITQLAVDCFSKPSEHIFLPSKVEFYRSDDGMKFTLISQGAEKSMMPGVPDGPHLFTAGFPEISARYLRVIAYNIGVCPPGRPGQGEKAWLMVDEILIK
jgi:hexosaminidase